MKTYMVVDLLAALAVSSFAPAIQAVGDCPSCGTVSVSVIGSKGELVHGGAYIALAQEGHSFREPVAEALSDRVPPSAVWRVPPGSYRALCLAEGFGPSSVLTGKVRTGGATNIVCTLEAALPLTGRILSEETGRPIIGASVTPVPMLLPSFAMNWSNLAQTCYRRMFATTTDKQGSYSVFAVPKTVVSFLVEAPGTASKLINGVVVGESPLALPDVILPPGGRLQVIGLFPPSVDPENYVADIFSFSQRGFDKPDEPALLRRRLGPDGIAEWRSLPPGYWAVRLNAGNADRLVLGAVKVTTGGFASLEFQVVACHLAGVVKGLPAEFARTAELDLSSGHTAIKSTLVPSTEKGQEDQANFVASLPLPGEYGIVLSLGPNNQSRVLLGTVTTKTDGGTINRTFEVPARELGGIVLNETGAPVEGAQVLVCTDDHGLLFESEACGTTSDASGHWSCSWLPAGELLALARQEGTGVSQIQKVPAGMEGAAVTLILTQGATVSGQLVVPTNADAANSNVGFACEAFPALVVHDKTGANGTFELANLPRCDGQFIVRPNDKALAFVWRQVPNAPQTDLGELRPEQAGAVFAVGSDVAPSGAEALLAKHVIFQGTRLCSKLFGWIGGVGTGLPNFPGATGYLYKLPSGSYRIEWTDLTRKVVARTSEIEVHAGKLSEVSFAAH